MPIPQPQPSQAAIDTIVAVSANKLTPIQAAILLQNNNLNVSKAIEAVLRKSKFKVDRGSSPKKGIKKVGDDGLEDDWVEIGLRGKVDITKEAEKKDSAERGRTVNRRSEKTKDEKTADLQAEVKELRACL